jgi:hypothetical protein
MQDKFRRCRASPDTYIYGSPVSPKYKLAPAVRTPGNETLSTAQRVRDINVEGCGFSFLSPFTERM